ncbi:MAG: PHB depolymerase family esterase [Kofleriaceae bacterium]
MSLVLALAAACGGDPRSGPRPTVFGGDRPTTLDAPSRLEEGELYPLVVVLHGYGASGAIQAGYLSLRSLPLEGKALLLTPNGTADSTGKLFWNADPSCCDFEHRNPDDAGYLGRLIDDVKASWPVDPSAVYVIGHSNGSFMAYRLACERADVVRAIAGLAGGASSMPTTCVPSQPVNVLHVHGTDDETVPYGGGFGPGAVASVNQWAIHNGCAATRTTGAPIDLDGGFAGAETTTEAADGCPAHGAVELWSIQGAGHIPASGAQIGQAMLQWLTSH